MRKKMSRGNCISTDFRFVFAEYQIVSWNNNELQSGKWVEESMGLILNPFLKIFNLSIKVRTAN